MGVVYLARNKLMDRLEVLKLLNKEMLTKHGTAERFLREIQSAAKLHHPNVVAAYTALQMGELLVFAMEYVEGSDLARLVRSRGPLPVLNACYFALQAAQGLQHAHERGMIHRDIKPGNLILLRQGKKAVVKILDFGLAKVTSEQRIDGTLTQQGQMLGTPDYIAPEQTLDAQKADIRSDIYSLGCTLYHLLTGRPPFHGNSLYEVLQAHHSVDARPLNLVRPDVPAELAAVVAKMMAKEPKRRYQTPAEVIQALRPFLKPGGPTGSQPQLSPAASQATQRWESLINTSPLDRPSEAPRIKSRAARGRPRWLRPAAAMCFLVLGLLGAWAAGVFSANSGIVVLQGLPDKADVLVDGEKSTVRIPEGDAPAEITVAAGNRKIQVKMEGFATFEEDVSLARGDKKVLTVRREPLPPKMSTKQPDRVATASRPADGANAKTAALKPPERLTAPFDESAARKGQETRATNDSTSPATVASEKTATSTGTALRFTNSLGMTMVRIEPGEFLMGTSNAQVDRLVDPLFDRKREDYADEQPQHPVKITQPFYLAAHEVTVGQFRRFVEASRYQTEAESSGEGSYRFVGSGLQKDPKISWRKPGFRQDDDHPVVCVSYNDAVALIEWLNAQEKGQGRTYRLPTEAEWEYACRAGGKGVYGAGDDRAELQRVAWFYENSGRATHPVGQKEKNAFGLYDMLGNASEWCDDWYDPHLYQSSIEEDPHNTARTGHRDIRGGAWFDSSRHVRASYRCHGVPSARFGDLGFRCAEVHNSPGPNKSQQPSSASAVIPAPTPTPPAMRPNTPAGAMRPDAPSSQRTKKQTAAPTAAMIPVAPAGVTPGAGSAPTPAVPVAANPAAHAGGASSSPPIPPPASLSTTSTAGVSATRAPPASKGPAPVTAAVKGDSATSSEPTELERKIKEARTEYDLAMSKAKSKLESQFDSAIAALGGNKNLKALLLAQAVQREQATWAANGSLPWSAPMRSSLKSYIQSVENARQSLERTLAKVSREAATANDERALTLLKAAESDAPASVVVGVWRCKGARRGTITLYSDGHLSAGGLNETSHGRSSGSSRTPRRATPKAEQDSLGKWSFRGDGLDLKIANPQSRNGYEDDRCALFDDGTKFTASNQFRKSFTATRGEAASGVGESR
jgi:formylglycine-generating enzyme required for sulfatase activity